jgi:hypothetical protein
MGTSAKTKPQRLQAPTNSRILWQNESQLTPSPELKATPQKRCVKSHASRGSRPRRIFSLPRHMVHEAHALLTALFSTPPHQLQRIFHRAHAGHGVHRRAHTAVRQSVGAAIDAILQELQRLGFKYQKEISPDEPGIRWSDHQHSLPAEAF